MQHLPFPRRLAALILLFAAFGLNVPPARAAADPTGWWLDASGKAGILIASCGGQLCGSIEWLRSPLNTAGQPKSDIHNPNPALRPRPLCGLTIMGGFAPDGAGGWHGGWIYDPSSGKTYRSVIHLAADGTLHVRGYIGIPLIGRAEVMTRPASPLPPCAGD